MLQHEWQYKLQIDNYLALINHNEDYEILYLTPYKLLIYSKHKHTLRPAITYAWVRFPTRFSLNLRQYKYGPDDFPLWQNYIHSNEVQHYDTHYQLTLKSSDRNPLCISYQYKQFTNILPVKKTLSIRICKCALSN